MKNISIVKLYNKYIKNTENVGKFTYFCPIEVDKEINYVVTIFRTDAEYLKKYELVWSWKGGIPSS